MVIVYARLTEQSVGRLFLAGGLPGLLLTALFVATVFSFAMPNPEAGPPGGRVPMRERFKVLVNSGALIFVVIIVLGGIYAGIFTVTEAAAVGAFRTFSHALWSDKLNLPKIRKAILDTI